MSSYISDVGALLNATSAQKLAKHSTTNNKDNTTLEMTDFLQLMVVQLQNQSLDSTMDTSDMLNQLVQMQMITALTNMTDASVMSYASSLVGKEVTIGDYSTGALVERVIPVTGTGVSNGKQVIFSGDEVFDLSSVMAVGRLPAKKDTNKTEEDKTPEVSETPEDKTPEVPETPETPDPVENPTEPTDETEENENAGQSPEDLAVPVNPGDE